MSKIYYLSNNEDWRELEGCNLEIVYIGDDFYFETGTMMSSIYLKTKEGFERFDWGFVQCALSKRNTLTIRPATPLEYVFLKKS